MIPEPKLDHLYQEVILDHNRNPRNFRELADATQYSHGVNPLCGDDYHLYLKIDEDGTIEDVGFHGAGCAISKSSASIMTTLIKGKNEQAVKVLQENFIKFMTTDESDGKAKATVGRMALFEGVKEFPVRVKCATLIWHALRDALADYHRIKIQEHQCQITKDISSEGDEVEIRAQVTPNPNTLKFSLGRNLLESGSYDFPTSESAAASPLATKLFAVENVTGVMIGMDFVTVAKLPDKDWQVIVPDVVETLQAFAKSGENAVIVTGSDQAQSMSEAEKKIREILDNEIRPAVARDGGDIVFYSFENGIVKVHLQGSCSACPSSLLTLKAGIEHRLKQEMPEIIEVQQV
ncbi:MAG: SUF system NifU family Fe-S cluster assembly protein [Candidatus Omnitrophota bacterium]|nr:SUF system NifU family Fe-S cluster assembly protein [Candidatus Omnitrophota bacterium]